ncbi:MAG: flagellar protein FlaG [Defluviitaleaceae bacterium]|nr:flagellar protein FlaG [Defluviitaleaceae bacterium]
MDVNRVNYQQAPPPPPVGGIETAVVQVQPMYIPTPAVDAQSVDTPEYSDSTLNRAIGEINTSIATHGRHLSVTFHQATGRNMVTVYDSETNEAIREIPPQRVLDAHASILELAGLFMDTRG